MSSEPMFTSKHTLSQPQLDVKQNDVVPVESGAREQLWRSIDSTSAGTSESSFAFQCPNDTVIDRRMYISGDYTFTLSSRADAAVTAANAAAFNANFPLSQDVGDAGVFCPAAFPLHNSMSSLQVTVNTVAMSESMAKFPDQLRLYDENKLKECAGICPTMQDNAALFNSYTHAGNYTSPAGGAGQTYDDHVPNNNYKLELAGDLAGANPWADADPAGSIKQATITYNGFEPVMHPALDVSGREQGLMCADFGVKINWSATPRAFRFNNGGYENQTLSMQLTGIANPKLHIRTFARSDLEAPIYRQVLPINQYQLSQANQSTFAAGASQTLYSPVLNTGRMPSAVLLYCAQTNRSIRDTDHSLVIESVTAQIGSHSQQVGFNTQDLYLMSQDNLRSAGARYNEFAGRSDLYAADEPGIGSYCALRFGKDIVLPAGVVPASVGSYQISFQAAFKNQLAEAQTVQFSALYIYEDAIITDMASRSSSLQNSMLSPSMVAEALQEPYEVEDDDDYALLMQGGSWWKSLKKGLKKASKFAKPIGSLVKQGIHQTGLDKTAVGSLATKGLELAGAGKHEDDLFY